MSGVSLVVEAEARFGWKERQARNYIESLKELIAATGKPLVAQSFDGHAKVFEINKTAKIAIANNIPTELVQPCTKIGAYYRGAILSKPVDE
jgi:hypothetical protein